MDDIQTIIKICNVAITQTGNTLTEYKKRGLKDRDYTYAYTEGQLQAYKTMKELVEAIGGIG